MAIFFSNIAFFGLVVTAVSGIAWAVGQFRQRETKARSVCIVAAIVTIFGLVGFGVTHEPGEKPQNPPTASRTEASSPEPAQGDTQQPTEPPPATTPTVNTPEPEEPAQSTAAPTETPTPTEEAEPPVASELVVNLPLQERPVMNGTGTERIGTWARIITTKEYLETIPDRALYEHLEAMAGNNYNWVNVTFGDGTGLYCYMDGYLIEYGCVDEKEGGAVEPGDGVDVRYFHFDSETGTYIEDEE